MDVKQAEMWQTSYTVSGSVVNGPSKLTSVDLVNAVDRSRSDLIRNPKDAYGFRSMSPFKAHEVIIDYDAQGCTFTGTQSRAPFATTTRGEWTGIPLDFRDVPQSSSMVTGGEQTDSLLAMRAEQNLAIRDINVLQFAAFLPATLKNIHDNLRKLDKWTDGIRDPRVRRELLKNEDPRSWYLQYLFVYNQLWRDIHGAIRYLKKKSIPEGALVTGRAFNKQTVPYHNRWSSLSPHRILHGYQGTVVLNGEIQMSQRAVSVARVTSELHYNKTNALGLDNPMYLAWDLLRWSWVIDQVADIGLFISSLTSLHGLEFLGTSVTTRTVNRCVVMGEDVIHTDPYTKWSFVARDGFNTSLRKQVTRNVYGQPTNVVTFRNPFKNNIAVTAAVAAALSLKMRAYTGDFSRVGR